MDDFERELKSGFLDEATQLISDAEQCFLTLESSPNDKSLLEKIFRLAHNLKGSGKAVGFDQLGEFTHELESYLLKLKSGDIPVQSSSVSLLLRCNDQLLKMVGALKENFDAKTDCTDLLADIRAHMSGEAQAVAGSNPIVENEAPTMPSEELSTDDISALLAAETALKMSMYSGPAIVAAAEEPTATEIATAAPVAELASVTPITAAASAQAAPKQQAPADESIRVSLARLEKLMNFVGELVILQTVLREQVAADPALRKAVHQLGKVTKEVQDISMSLRMVPLKQTFQKMTRIVRDTSASLNKSVTLTLLGEDTEVDKTVLENLGDPLVHLIRNSVDHGIESTEARRAAGKPEGGTVILNALHQSGSLVIEIRDDGAGLDPVKLTNKAIEKGILKPGTVLSEKDAYQLIFASGFSTKAQVTDISGRGVGMDVVKTNIERLQGDISIETQLGKGTCFRIRLPLTLAIVDGMVIKSDDERFVIPLNHVHESVKPEAADVHYVTGMGEVFSLRGENLPLYRLNHLLGRKSQMKPAHENIAIVVRTQEKPFAVLVDDILGQYQVVIKKLGDEHRALKGFSGSAILGDGRPSLILELPELITKAKPIQQVPQATVTNITQRGIAV